MSRRVVITGLGVLSGAGANVEEFQRNITAGVCCLSPITDPRAAHFKSRYAGLLTKTAAAALEPLPEPARFDRHVQMAMVAAREALASAAVRPENFGRRLGLVFATCSGPMLLIEAHYERIIRGDLRLTEEELLAKQYYSGARVLARELGVQGLSTTVVTACSASTAAMALAADLIRCGMLDAALAGGADAFSTSTLAGFEGLKATSEGKCAPFSKPFGLNLGEAAAFVFLESLDGAHRARGEGPRRNSRLGHEQRCVSLLRARTGGTRPGNGHATRARRRRTFAGTNLLHQRPRHRHRGQRQGRGQSRPQSVRRAGGTHAHQFHQEHGRPLPGRGRGGGSHRRHRVRGVRRPAAHRQLHRAARRLRAGLRAGSRTGLAVAAGFSQQQLGIWRT